MFICKATRLGRTLLGCFFLQTNANKLKPFQKVSCYKIHLETPRGFAACRSQAPKTTAASSGQGLARTFQESIEDRRPGGESSKCLGLCVFFITSFLGPRAFPSKRPHWTYLMISLDLLSNQLKVSAQSCVTWTKSKTVESTTTFYESKYPQHQFPWSRHPLQWPNMKCI